MSKTTDYFSAASCVLAIASLVLAIIGIVVLRRGPLRQAVTAWIGLVLCGLPMAYWGSILWIFLNMTSANPF